MTQPDPTPPAGGDDSEKLVLNSPEQASSPKDFALWAGVILLAVLSVYSPAMRGKFIWDDNRHVQENRALQDAPGLLNIWAAHWRYLINGNPKVLTPQYYPMTHTTFWIEAQLSGFVPGSQATMLFHITNMVLHAGGAILLWFLLRDLGVRGAWVAAAIFALHPIQVESVAWISERKNVLAGVFYFGALLAYVRSGFGIGESGLGSRVSGLGGENANASSSSPEARNPKPDTRLYSLSLALFVLAMLSKSIACSMPAVMLLLIWWKRGRIAGRDLLRLAPFFAFGIVMAIFTGWVERSFVGASGPDWVILPVERVLIAGRAVWFYVAKLLWPVNLTFIYPRWDISAGDPVQWIAPIAVSGMLGLLFVLRQKIGRGPVVAFAIFVGVLLPALGFVNFYPMRYAFVADHFQYLAGAALIALAVSVAARLLDRVSASPATGLAATAVVLLPLVALTAMRTRAYADSLALWQDTVRKNPDSWMVQNSVGAALLEEARSLPRESTEERNKMLNEAIRHFERAIALREGNDRALLNWGRALNGLNRPEEAITKFDQAIALNPNAIDALMDRAITLDRLKKTADAKAAFAHALSVAEAERTTLRSRQAQAQAHAFLGKIANEQNNQPAAIEHYRKAVALAPSDALLRVELAQYLVSRNDLSAAAVELDRAQRLNPSLIDARIEMGLLKLKVGNLAGARTELQIAGSIARASDVDPLLTPITLEQAKRLLEAGKMWSDAFEASTRPATKPTTAGVSGVMKKLQRTQETTSEVFTTPATRPSR